LPTQEKIARKVRAGPFSIASRFCRSPPVNGPAEKDAALAGNCAPGAPRFYALDSLPSTSAHDTPSRLFQGFVVAGGWPAFLRGGGFVWDTRNVPGYHGIATKTEAPPATFRGTTGQRQKPKPHPHTPRVGHPKNQNRNSGAPDCGFGTRNRNGAQAAPGPETRHAKPRLGQYFLRVANQGLVREEECPGKRRCPPCAESRHILRRSTGRSSAGSFSGTSLCATRGSPAFPRASPGVAAAR